MKKFPAYLFLIAISSVILASSCKSGGTKEAKMAYSTAKKVDTVFDYNGTKVADPYNWLEADGSDDVKNWIEEENKLTFGYIDSIPYKQNIRKRLEEIWNYPKYSAPSKKGDYYFFSKNDGLQNQSVIYRQKGLDGEPEVFLDPNELSADGTVALGGMSFSNDNKYVAISTSAAGSDWQTINILDVETKKLFKSEDALKWVKFSSPAWKGNGFY
jgi:prolyl oligopeptidase